RRNDGSATPSPFTGRVGVGFLGAFTGWGGGMPALGWDEGLSGWHRHLAGEFVARPSCPPAWIPPFAGMTGVTTNNGATTEALPLRIMAP
ncbi:MAG TPA: hypothetical protein PLY86_21315, partial [bacterium]|nr:hypothetical protein [bacterium]